MPLRLREQAPGFAGSTSMYCRQTRAHPARDPSGFSSTCSPRPGGDPGKSRARQSLPQKLGNERSDVLLFAVGPSVKRRRSDGKGRVPRTRCGPGRPAFGDRAGALPPNPADRSEPAAARPARNRGCISLVTFFVQAKKVTRPPGRRTKSDRDERPAARSAERQSQNGFRLSPE